MRRKQETANVHTLLDKETFERARAYADENGITLRKVLEDSLKQFLETKEMKKEVAND